MPVWGQAARVIFRSPLKVLQQFSRLNTQRYRQILVGMELIPIAVRRESPQRATQFFKRHWALARGRGTHARNLFSLCHERNSRLGWLARSAGWTRNFWP